MNKPEKIISAAIRYEAFQLESDEIITITIMGTDYDHAIECNIAGYAEPLDGIELGFMTSNKRFVDPTSAKKIAVMQDQLKLLNENGIKSSELLEEGFTEITINASERTVINLLGKLKPEDLY